jgi:Rrf2 family protein
MEVSAKVDYGMRALLELTAAYARDPLELTKSEAVATAQRIPAKYLESILGQLRASGVVLSQRGADGGFRLARDPDGITVADVVRALNGPLTSVRGIAPEDAAYTGPAEHLLDVWIATRSAVRSVLEHVSLAQVAEGRFPDDIRPLIEQPGAWQRRWPARGGPA